MNDLEQALLGRRAERVRLLLADARDLAEVTRSRGYLLRECASVAEYGERFLGMSGAEACRLAAVGRALAGFPELEEMLRAGTVSADGAAALAEIAEHPELRRPGDDWLAWARKGSARAIRRRVLKRIREVEARERVREIPVFLTEGGHGDLRRAQALMSTSMRRWVSPSEVVETCVREWLQRHDVMARREGRRRMGPTGGRRSRGVPATVERRVLARTGGKCSAAYCENQIVELAHIQPWAEGAGQEEDDLFPACPIHHRMYDDGRLTMRRVDGRPVLFDRTGRSLDERGPPG